MSPISFTLVSTILNDRAGAVRLIEDLKNQTRFPSEFVVVDGGSRDGTYEFLMEAATTLPFPLRVSKVQGANVSRGRNLAIESASHPVIVSTDFGCRLDPYWMEELVAPFEKDPSIEIVTGSWQIRESDRQTPAQWAEWALANGRIGMIATPTCLASTRSIAFRKSVWQAFGRYPEDLTLAGDDALFSLWMVSSGKKIAAAPKAMCDWHRFPRLKSYFKEARRNFFGCGEALFFLNFGLKVGLLHLLEILSLSALILSSIWLRLISPEWIALAFFTAFLWSKRLIRWATAWRWLARHQRLDLAGWVVLFDLGTRFYGVLGYWTGFVNGFFKCHECRVKVHKLGIPRW